MTSQNEVEARIRKIEKDYAHVLTGSLATVHVNAPRALMQAEAEAILRSLYWVIGKKYKSQLKGVNT